MNHEEYMAFLNKVTQCLETAKLFSVQQYPGGRTLLKVLMDSETQFTAEIKGNDWEARLGSNEVDLLFNSLFTSNKVQGEIDMKSILCDAETSDEGLKKFFKRSQNSLYRNEPPKGLHGGNMLFQSSKPVIFYLNDFAENKNITGQYIIKETSETMTDSKGREAVILKWKKR